MRIMNCSVAVVDRPWLCGARPGARGGRNYLRFSYSEYQFANDAVGLVYRALLGRTAHGQGRAATEMHDVFYSEFSQTCELWCNCMAV